MGLGLVSVAWKALGRHQVAEIAIHELARRLAGPRSWYWCLGELGEL